MKIEKTIKTPQKITITDKSKTYCIKTADITYITCLDYVCTFHVVNKESGLPATRQLKYHEEKLNGCGFFRVSRQTLVNIDYIVCLQTICKEGKKTWSVNVNGKNIETSRRKYYLLKKILSNM
jgi:DNA-binding LytR/AlgR family response regulator